GPEQGAVPRRTCRLPASRNVFLAGVCGGRCQTVKPPRLARRAVERRREASTSRLSATAPNLEWAHITSHLLCRPPAAFAECALEHFRPPPLPRGTSDAH